jgi:hypothetical protein
MYFETLLTLTLALLPTTILAAPTSAPLEERATCTTIYPDYARVSHAQPVESYLPGFTISQAAGATNKNDMFIEFTVPPGSYGCQLETYFPPGSGQITASGRQDIYIYSTDRALSRSPRGIDVSWAYCPAPVSQVGTTKFESNPTTPTKKVISSFVCQPKMTYRLSIGRDFTDAGSVSFAQGTTAGLRMTYNC